MALRLRRFFRRGRGHSIHGEILVLAFRLLLVFHIRLLFRGILLLTLRLHSFFCRGLGHFIHGEILILTLRLLLAFHIGLFFRGFLLLALRLRRFFRRGLGHFIHGKVLILTLGLLLVFHVGLFFCGILLLALRLRGFLRRGLGHFIHGEALLLTLGLLLVFHVSLLFRGFLLLALRLRRFFRRSLGHFVHGKGLLLTLGLLFPHPVAGFRGRLPLLHPLVLGQGAVLENLVFGAELVGDPLGLTARLHFLLHGLEHLGVPALFPGQSGVVGAGQGGIFIFRLGFGRLRAVAGFNPPEGLCRGVVAVLPGVPLLGLDEIPVPSVIIFSLVEGPFPELGLILVNLRVLQGIALVGVIPLVGHGVENLHIGVGHGLGVRGVVQGSALQQVFVELDSVPLRVPSPVKAVLQRRHLHGFGRPPLLEGKVVFQGLHRLFFGIQIQAVPGVGGKEVVELGPVGCLPLRGKFPHHAVVKGRKQLLPLLQLGLLWVEDILKPSHGLSLSGAGPGGCSGPAGSSRQRGFSPAHRGAPRPGGPRPRRQP